MGTYKIMEQAENEEYLLFPTAQKASSLISRNV
jgi:hypothetical protein